MCRLLGYLGEPRQPDTLIYHPDHSLVVQSYQPRQMTAGLLNADGFGLGWFDQAIDSPPYLYKNILPIWSDINLPFLSRYIHSGCFVGYVRSATPPLAVDFTNCQPFSEQRLLYVHNGFIEHFRTTLYRPLRNLLSDQSYLQIHGTTDSEHIFALIVDTLRRSPDLSLASALAVALGTLTDLAKTFNVYFSANILLADGKQLVACRYASREPEPSLYWLAKGVGCPDGVIIASEPLFEDQWQAFPAHSLLEVQSPDCFRLYHLHQGGLVPCGG